MLRLAQVWYGMLDRRGMRVRAGVAVSAEARWLCPALAHALEVSAAGGADRG